MKRTLIPLALVAGLGLVFAAVNATAKDKPRGRGRQLDPCDRTCDDRCSYQRLGDRRSRQRADLCERRLRQRRQSQGRQRPGLLRADRAGDNVGVQLDERVVWRPDHGRRSVLGHRDTVVAITGGTGKYRNAPGWMELNYHDAAGTKFDFVFHLHGGY